MVWDRIRTIVHRMIISTHRNHDLLSHQSTNQPTAITTLHTHTHIIHTIQHAYKHRRYHNIVQTTQSPLRCITSEMNFYSLLVYLFVQYTVFIIYSSSSSANLDSSAPFFSKTALIFLLLVISMHRLPSALSKLGSRPSPNRYSITAT